MSLDLTATPQAGAYQLLLVDPPWNFKTRGKQGAGSRHADRHYETMTLKAIEALPVAQITARDCWLFMWTSGPWVPAALKIMKAWGFAYSTRVFTWAKLKPGQGDQQFMMERDFPIGTGYTSRHQTEIVLLGRKGSPKRVQKNVPELIFAPKREHSRKPDEIYSRCTRLGGDVPRLEMFARQTAPGWDAFGLEVTKFDGAP